MTKHKSISMYTDEESKKIIEDASKLIGLDKSAFCRMSSLEKARKVIKENKEESE